MNLRVAPVFYHISPSEYNHFPREPGIWLRAARFAIRPLQPSTFIHLASPHSLTGAFPTPQEILRTPPETSFTLHRSFICTPVLYHDYISSHLYYHTGLLVLLNSISHILSSYRSSHYNISYSILTLPAF